MKTHILLTMLLMTAIAGIPAQEISLASDPAAGPRYSLLAMSRLPCTIVFDFKDAANYCQVEISRREMIFSRIADSRSRPLGRHALKGLLPGENRIQARINGPQVTIYINDMHAGAAAFKGLGPGRYGISGTYTDFSYALHVKARFTDDFERRGQAGAWTPSSGAWGVKRTPNPHKSVSPYQCAGRGDDALALTGNALWDNYIYSVSILRGEDAAAAGLVFYHSASRHYRVMLDGRTVRLIRQTGDRTAVLASADLRLAARSWQRLTVVCADSGVEIIINGTAILKHEGPRHPGGMAGLATASKGLVFFDDVSILPAETIADPQKHCLSIPPLPMIRPAFKNDRYMTSWTRAGPLKLAGPGTAFDFTFFRQPVHWEYGEGAWGIHSRWACEPKSSWFTGAATPEDRTYALWLRQQIGGDFKIRLFAAVKMRERGLPFYEFPCNFNLSLSARPGVLTDDITLSFGGPDQPCRILKGDRIVAENSTLVKPGTRKNYDRIIRTFHKDWFEVVFERKGEELSIGTPQGQIVKARIPQDKDHPYLCLWGIDSGIAIARMQSVFGQAEPLDAATLSLLARPVPVRDSLGAALFYEQELIESGRRLLADPALPPAPRQAPHPGLSAFFGKPVYAEPLTPQSSGLYDDCLVTPEKEAGAFRITNRNLGGAAAVILHDQPLFPAATPEIRFSYRLPQAMNLELTAWLRSGRILRHPLRLKADNAWHEYSLDLGKRLTSVQEPVLRLGIRQPYPYSQPQGTTWFLKDIRLIPLLPPAPDTDTLLPGGQALGLGENQLLLLSHGTQDIIPVRFSPAAAEADPLPKPEIRLEGQRVYVGLPGPAFSLVDPASITLTIGGTRLEAAHPALTMKKNPGAIVFDLAACDAGFTAPRACEFKARLFDGRTIVAAGKLAPPVDTRGPRIAWVYPLYSQRLCHETFDADDPDSFAPAMPGNHRRTVSALTPGPDPALEIRPSEGAKTGGEAHLFRTPIDVAKFPLLILRYRCPERTGFMLNYRRDNAFFYGMGIPGGLRSDGMWHVMRLDLRTYVKAGEDSDITYIFLKLNESGARINRVQFDDIQLASPDSPRITMQIRAEDDISGIAGYSWVVDSHSGTIPPEKLMQKSDQVELTQPLAGSWFHVRACDKAGNWGEVHHIRVGE